MKDIIVLILISPIVFIGLRSLWKAFVQRKSSCGSCTRCGTTHTNCALPESDEK